ncbi:pyridoxamine 5'-phosphate oxidase family protein [Halopenitus persicus]|uniref:pyridoxamine 5'-phosphate oxidase family protein n=1 Tax=Halopenitus persicus TaxID=1048396 RepID=UPI000BBAC8B3|nr:pyridoxamine 5'-phosphate oxidase family protein [Halopenitus persicus]
MKPLDEAEIEEVLIDNGLGVLSLVEGTEPYGIPMSFGYGDEMISFMMQREGDAESRKMAALESNPTACLTVYEHEEGPPERWRSVIVTGELYEIPDDEEGEAFFNLADNAVFAPDFDVLNVSPEEIDLRYIGLTIEDISGREYSPLAVYGQR